MKEFLEEILVENADMSLHGKVQEYLQSIMEVDFRTSEQYLKLKQEGKRETELSGSGESCGFQKRQRKAAGI